MKVSYLKKTNPKALAKLFSEGLIDFDNKDTFKGIENEMIEKFEYHFLLQYNDAELAKQDKIDRELFFASFMDPEDTYHKMKDRFIIGNQLKVFEEYLYL